MPKTSIKGYKRNSPDKDEPELLIPSNKISMKNVPHKVLGIDNFGYSQIMEPNFDYEFPGDYVIEKPIKRKLQKGGELLPKIGSREFNSVKKENKKSDNTIISKKPRKLSEAELKEYERFREKQEKNRFAKNSNYTREELTTREKRTPESDEHRRKQNQKYANSHGGYVDENGDYVQGTLNDVANSKAANKIWDNIIEPGVNAELLMSGAGALGKGALRVAKDVVEKSAIKQTGKQLEKPLNSYISSTSQRTPWLDIKNPNYNLNSPNKFLENRSFGKMEKGVVRGEPSTQESIMDGFVSNRTKKSKENFKSEIDWNKWNKEIPENKALMQEYNAIEQQADNQLPEIPHEIVLDNHTINLERLAPKNKKKMLSFGDEDLGNDLTLRTNPSRIADESTIIGKNRSIKSVLNKKTNESIDLKTWQDTDGKVYYYMSANMPSSKLKAGKAYLELEKHVPVGESLLENSSLSYDSFLNILKQTKNPKFESFIKGSIPMNNSAKTNILKNSRETAPLIEFAKKSDADNAVAELNNLLNKHNLPNASVTNEYGNFSINLPNIGLKKLYTILGITGVGTAYNQIEQKQNGGSIGNNGMFDMTNPNIYKGLIPAAVGTAALKNQEKMKYGGTMNKLGVENSLWNNIRAKAGSGKKPSKEMLEQERKISKKQMGGEPEFDANNPLKYSYETLIQPGLNTPTSFRDMNMGNSYNPQDKPAPLPKPDFRVKPLQLQDQKKKEQQEQFGLSHIPILATNILAKTFSNSMNNREIERNNQRVNAFQSSPTYTPQGAAQYGDYTHDLSAYRPMAQLGGQYSEGFGMETVAPQINMPNQSYAPQPQEQYVEENVEENNVSLDSDELTMYLKHQQGKKGIELIKKAAEQGLEEVPKSWNKENIQSNMKNNIYKDFKGKLTPANFLNYWAKKIEKNKQLSAKQESPYDQIFQEVGQQVGIDPLFLKAVAKIESGWNPDSNKNAKTQYKGLFQLNKNEAKKHGIKDLYNPYESTLAGAKNLKFQEGGEYEMSEDEIEEFILQGGQLKYLD